MSGSLSSVSVLAILSPLGRLVERARNISNNPLSHSLYTGRTDEFGQIEFALRMMQAETGAIGGRIGDASNRLSEHTRGLLKDIESSNCSGQQKLATALEFFQNNRSDSFGVKPPLY